MSFKEVKELRKAGKLDEALAKALADLESAIKGVETEAFRINKIDDTIELFEDKITLQVPTGLLWAKRSLAWVYYDYLGKYAKQPNYDLFFENLLKIKELQLPSEEKLIYDSCAWQIGSMVFSLQKMDPVEYDKINMIFDIIQDFLFTRPSNAFSFLFKAFHKGYHFWDRYLEFAEWWNFENFRTEDFLEDEYNGKKSMALAEQGYIAYSKKLLEGEVLDASVQHRELNKERVQAFLPQLDLIIEKYPGYQYPPYFKAKLLLALGKEENLLSVFLPFAKKKRNDFWVWELLAEAFQEDNDIYFACYCKALSLKTQDEYLVKTRQVLASMLIARSMFNEAKTEIEKIIETRTKNEWRIPYQVSSWIGQEWYKSATASRDNKEFYRKYVKNAEEILFQDVREEIVVVEFVNEDKTMLNFVKDIRKHGFFNYRGHLDSPRVGDILAVRFSDEGNNGFFKVLTARVTAPDTVTDAIKSFDGTIKIISQGIGFVDDVFVEPRFIKEFKFTDGQMVKGKAILSFNKKKNQWGWKAISFF